MINYKHRIINGLASSPQLFRFSSSSSLRWAQSFQGRFTPIDSISDPRNDQFYIMRLNLISQVQIRFKLDSTLSYLSETIQTSEGNAVEKVNFFSISGAKLPLCERIQDLTDMPIFCQVNEDRVFALNFSQEFEIKRVFQSSPITDEEHFFDFATGIGLKGYQKFLFSNFAHKVIHALPNNKNASKREEIGESLAQVFRFYQSSGHQTAGYLGLNSRVVDQKNRLALLEDQVASRQHQLNQLWKNASKKSTFLCLLGSSIAIGQFAFIAAGTFHYLSWDIMEPVCYLMTFGNFTFSFFFYLAAKKDLELTNIHEIITYRFQQRAAKRLGIDLKQHEADKAEIEEINQSLKLAYDV